MTNTSLECALQAQAAKVGAELQARDDAWGTSGWTRRRFLAGVGMAGVAAMGTQLVTARGAYAATPSTDDRTLVVVFMRGAADGLRILQPASSDTGLDYLKTVRGNLTLGEDSLLTLDNSPGWGLNKKMQPLYDTLHATGELAFVPGCSSNGITRSHFQAQQWLEMGGTNTSTTGWLERTLEGMGPGTTFRSIAQGASLPASLTGPIDSLTMNSLNNFIFPGWDGIRPQSQKAVADLYRGMGGFLGEDVPATLNALGTADTIRKQAASSVKYPSGNFGSYLADIARILRAEVGLQVATVDVGGWDTHTDEATDLDKSLDYAAKCLQAFMNDLGTERRKRVTVAVVTEFGRRVAMNASGGTDHGHGSLMWLLGGGLNRSGVFGSWDKLTATTLDDGDVPGFNNPFDVLGELAQKRLGIGSLSNVFYNYSQNSLGVATAA